MNPHNVALLVFGSLFGTALVGMCTRAWLPGHHLTAGRKVVREPNEKWSDALPEAVHGLRPQDDIQRQFREQAVKMRLAPEHLGQ